MRFPPLGILALVLSLGPEPVAAQSACADLCRVACVKPISIADRWDDVTGVPGYRGEPNRPDWRNIAADGT